MEEEKKKILEKYQKEINSWDKKPRKEYNKKKKKLLEDLLGMKKKVMVEEEKKLFTHKDVGKLFNVKRNAITNFLRWHNDKKQ